MEQKPNHYDGSVQINSGTNESSVEEAFVMTDEMRKNIGRNPYSIDTNE